MQQQEYNKLRERLNELVPELLELSFGCEVHSKRFEGVGIVFGKGVTGYLIQQPGYDGLLSSRFSTYEIPKNDFKIIGHPPELRHLLLGIYSTFAEMTTVDAKKQSEILSMLSYYVTSEGEVIEPDYDLTKPLSEQSEETLIKLNKLLK